jgi:hypothetical protein
MNIASKVVVGVVLVAGLLLTCTSFAQPQAPRPPLEEMKKLDFLVGRWEGTGRMQMGPGAQEEARVTEIVQPKLGGAIVMIEGIGRVGEDDRIVHHALGVISFDAQAKEYRMRAYRADGRFVDPVIELQEKKIVWSFDDPRAGSIRYTITINEKGQWREIGEMSRDGGKTWNPFFEMTLDRKAADPSRHSP